MKIGAQLYTVHEHTKTLPDLAEALKRWPILATAMYRFRAPAITSRLG